jgi:ribosome biogenesis GTPase
VPGGFEVAIQETSVQNLCRQKTGMVEKLTGQVLKAIRKHFWVETREGVFHCSVRETIIKSMRETTPITVGDKVVFDLLDEREREAIITQVLPRRTKLSRKAQADLSQPNIVEDVVAANIDQLVIVSAAQNPPLRPGLIDRYLIAAAKGGLEPLICVNKMDLADWTEIQPTIELYRQLGYPAITTCAKTGEGTDELKTWLCEKASVFAGHSGVGKSTLLKRLCPGIEVKTEEVNPKTGRGKHATTAATLVHLPSGGYVIDTPGIRQFSLWDLAPEDVSHYFIEIAEHGQDCRFRNCTHTVEPDCAVRAALDEGLIHPQRFESYLKLLEECREPDVRCRW